MFKYLRTSAALLALIGIVAANAQIIPAEAAFDPQGWNELRKNNGDGTFTSQIYQKQTNYVDDNDKWQKIDLTLESNANGWTMGKAPYHVVVPLRANGDMIFTATNRYDRKTNTVRNDAPLSNTRIFTSAKNVVGSVTSEGVLYPNAFDTIGADLLLQLETDEMRYLIKWDSYPTACNTNTELVIPFRQDGGGVIPKKLNGQAIGGNDEVVKGFAYSVNDFRGISTPEARVWDSDGREQDIDIVAKFTPNILFGKKVVPCSFFSGATYPVYADDVFYPNPHAETTSVDGEVRYEGVATWDQAHDAPTGTSASDSAATILVQTGKAGGNPAWSRGFILFDTSALGAGVTVTAMTVGLYVNSKTNDISDANDTIEIVTGANPASNTAIITADYDLCGAVNSPTDAVTAIDIGSISAGAYNTFTGNAAGIAAVSLTGITKLCIREGHDTADADPTYGAEQGNGVQIRSADTADVTSDPILTVTYTSGGGSSGPPKQVIIISIILDFRAYA